MDEFVDQTKTLVGALGWDIFREVSGRPVDTARLLSEEPSPENGSGADKNSHGRQEA